MIVLLYIAVVLGQAVYWLFMRDETERLSAIYFDACVHPGGSK